MKSRPVVLIYCQHSLGMGHLVRSFSLAAALAPDFRVVFLNGGPLPAQPPVPDGVEIVQLAPLGMAEGGGLVSRDRRFTVEQAKASRRDRIMAIFARTRPDVIIVELFPFGRQKFADELLPLLTAGRRSARPPVTLCSLRDLLVDRGAKQRAHDNRTARIVNDYFDGVLLHADPAFARLEESFRPDLPLTPPVYYTGFVAPGGDGSEAVVAPGSIVVSAGSGIVGAALFDAAVEAQKDLWRKTRLPMAVVAGPFLPEDAWRELCRKAGDRPGLTLFRAVPNIGTELRQAAVSVSQCGYNTAMDILGAEVPALVVPFVRPKENEQINRARRLKRLGVVDILEPERLDGMALAQAIGKVLDTEAVSGCLDLNGAERTAAVICDLAAKRDKPPTLARVDHAGFRS